MPTTIADVMTARVVTMRSGESVAAAVERMTRFGFSALPVVTASSRLVGIVSLLDVLRLRQEAADRAETVDERAVAVDEIMTADVLALPATANVGAVADRLRRYGDLRVLPIVDGKRLVGVVTRGDLLRRLLPGGAPPRRRRGLFGGGARRADDDAADALALLAAARARRASADPGAAVRDVMTSAVATAAPEDLLLDAAVRMLRGRHSALPVVDGGGQLLGVVSEADLLTDTGARRSELATVAGVMTSPAVSVRADATVAQARALLVERGLRTLPVVDADGRLVGVLGRSDLV